MWDNEQYAILTHLPPDPPPTSPPNFSTLRWERGEHVTRIRCKYFSTAVRNTRRYREKLNLRIIQYTDNITVYEVIIVY